MRLRPARPEDAGAVADLNLRAMRAAYEGFVAAEHLDAVGFDGLRERWREALADAGAAAGAAHRTIVADEGGAIAGFVRVGASRDPDARTGDGELHALYVEPDRLGTGLGRSLLAAGEQELVRAGHLAATLWVLAPNTRAWRFYERHGWAIDDAPFDDGRWSWARSVRLRKVLGAPT